MTPLNILSKILFILAAAALTACCVDDPGPIQEIERQYAVVGFDRLEMGDAFHIRVEAGDYFDVSARGDRRNIDDLVVRREGNTLLIRYGQNRQRRHDTFITITLPELHSVNFSGASDARVYGFTDVETFTINLSGASACQLDVDAAHVKATLSGASLLTLRGAGNDLNAEVSGASALKAYAFPVANADIMLSGGSDGQVTVTNSLEVVATGASHLMYRGQPQISSEVSGASSVHRD